eukprot:1028135-Rhodomonas_salina.2
MISRAVERGLWSDRNLVADNVLHVLVLHDPIVAIAIQGRLLVQRGERDVRDDRHHLPFSGIGHDDGDFDALMLSEQRSRWGHDDMDAYGPFLGDARASARVVGG